MPVIHIPRRTYQQPQGGASPDPAAMSALSVCGGFLFPAGGADADLMGGRLVATAAGTVFPFGSVAGLSSVAYERGVFGRFFRDEGTSRVVNLYTGQPSTRAFTTLARVRLNAAPASPGVVMRSGNLSTGGTTIPLWRNVSSFDMRVGGTDYTGAGTWNLGQWYDIAIIGTASSCVMIVNGVETISGAAAAAGTIETTLGFGGVVGGGLASGDFDISFFVVCNRALSAQEARGFFDNPWRLYKSQPRRIYSFPTGDIRIARPSSDIAAGAWTPSTGSDLFAALDETSVSDADYISTAIESSCTLALSDTSGTRDGYVLRVRAWSSDGSGMVVTLKQGETVIAAWTDNPLPASATTINHTLTAEQIASITDHSALRVTLEAIA